MPPFLWKREMSLCIVSWFTFHYSFFSLSLSSAGNGDPALNEADYGEKEIDDVHNQVESMWFQERTRKRHTTAGKKGGWDISGQGQGQGHQGHQGHQE